MVTPKSDFFSNSENQAVLADYPKMKTDKYVVGLYFMSNFCIPSYLGQSGMKLMELCKLQFSIYLEMLRLGLATQLARAGSGPAHHLATSFCELVARHASQGLGSQSLGLPHQKLSSVLK
jgi:hypothetical protein